MPDEGVYFQKKYTIFVRNEAEYVVETKKLHKRCKGILKSVNTNH